MQKECKRGGSRAYGAVLFKCAAVLAIFALVFSYLPIRSANTSVRVLAASVSVPETGAKQKLMSLSDINKKFKKYGKMTIPGMKAADYDKAMALEWKPLGQTGEPQDIAIDLKKLMDYKSLEGYLFNLDKYEGVEVYDIGDSGRKRNIYMAVLDYANKEKPAADKPVILITGSVHAIEFAGAEFAVKSLNDTVIKAKSDPYTRLLLENVKIAAVPLVNPDGRELIIQGKAKNKVWKANAAGIDLNRNMPALNAGQLVKGTKKNAEIAKKPGEGYFPGYNLGSESESRAMIRFFNTWVTDKNTRLYMDLHQQAGWQFYNKAFLSTEGDARSKGLAKRTNKLLKHRYPPKLESKSYGIDGAGGTMTDYARSVAEGMAYSYRYGRLVLMADGAEKPLITFKDVDKARKYYKPANPNFASFTIEIAKAGSIGAGKAARKLRDAEYGKYNWANFLTGTIENVLGPEKVSELKAQAAAIK
jgi:hypothetical protein